MNEVLALSVDFYKEVVEIIHHYGLLVPMDIDMSSNPRYSSHAGDVIQMEENLTFYDKVLDSLDFIVDESDNIDDGWTYVGEADDVGDPDWMGEYDYASAYLIAGVPFLLMKNGHPWVYPDMAMIYGPEYQINISTADRKISVSPMNPDVRRRFMIGDERDRVKAIRDYLQHSDRPDYRYLTDDKKANKK